VRWTWKVGLLDYLFERGNRNIRLCRQLGAGDALASNQEALDHFLKLDACQTHGISLIQSEAKSHRNNQSVLVCPTRHTRYDISTNGYI
jgi:hypothetical protein